MAGARDALDYFSTSLDQLTEQRGIIGTSLARLNVAQSVLSNQSVTLKAAESRILDADVAQESAELARQSIVQQAATAVLAQANLQPSLVLSLLQE